MASLWRAYRLPHLFFALVLLVILIFGTWRLREYVTELQRLRADMQQLTLDLQRLEALRKPIRGTRSLLTPGGPAPRALLADLQDLRDRFGTAERFVVLAGTPYFRDLTRELQQLQALMQAVAERPSEVDAGELQATLDELDEAWVTLNNQALATLAQRTNALMRRQRQLLGETALALMAILLLAVTYQYVVQAAIAGPVARLAQTARRVTRGDLRARAEPRGAGPVAELGSDFNAMVDILVESLYAEQRVISELRRKTRELEAANRHKSQFLANVSHELKTPLSAIIGFADILSTQRHGALSERQLDYAQRIHDAGRHLLAMITDLIDVAKLDVGRLQLRPEVVDPATAVREVRDLLQPQAEAKEQELSVRIGSKLPELHHDPRRLRQMLLNLAGNAVKFTPHGGRVALQVRRADGGVRFAVCDTGIGIPRAEQSRIFEDFVQLDSELQRQHEGTGIGLPLTRRLAELMGGSLQLESAPDKGSTFTLELPQRQPRQERTD